MLRLLLSLAFAAGLLVPAAAVGQTSQEASWLTGDALVHAAHKLEAELIAGGTAVLVQRFDSDAFLHRVTAGRPVLLDELDASTSADLTSEFLVGLLERLGEISAMTFLGPARILDTERARFRVISEAGLGYFDLALIPAQKGLARVVDLYAHIIAEDASDLLGRSLEAEFLSESRTPAANMSLLFREGRPREAWELFPEVTLTDGNRKLVLNLLVRVGLALGGDELRVAADAYRAAFPDDPSLPLILFDAQLLTGDYTEALASLDALDRNVGGDPYIDVLRASVYIEMGREMEARQHARLATDAMPTFYPALISETGIALLTADYDRVIELLVHMTDALEADFDPAIIEADPELAGLVASEAYRRWRDALGTPTIP